MVRRKIQGRSWVVLSVLDTVCLYQLVDNHFIFVEFVNGAWWLTDELLMEAKEFADKREAFCHVRDTQNYLKGQSLFSDQKGLGGAT